MKAVRFDRFGGPEVLQVEDVDTPQPGNGEVLVEVRAAGINPGEASIRKGLLEAMYPTTLPCGEGSDLAGVITALGAEVTGWSVGDEVVGWVDTRSSHAQYVVVPAEHLVAKPEGLAWEIAGGSFVVGATAWAATGAVRPSRGDVVAVSAAAGGVGGLVSQLLVERGATVLGIAGPENADWLRGKGVTPIDRTGGLDVVADRLREAAPEGIDAFIDLFGGGYVELALALGVPGDRVNTIIDFGQVGKNGVLGIGSTEGSSAEVLSEIVTRLADGRLELPVQQTYPLDAVRDAFTELEQRHTRGKIVLLP